MLEVQKMRVERKSEKINRNKSTKLLYNIKSNKERKIKEK